MAGNPKHAQLVTDHLRTSVEAAAPITRAGHGRTMILTGGLGLLFVGLFGGKAGPGEIKVSGRTWLALLPSSFALIGADSLRGRPKGEPFARISYAEVAANRAEAADDDGAGAGDAARRPRLPLRDPPPRHRQGRRRGDRAAARPLRHAGRRGRRGRLTARHSSPAATRAPSSAREWTSSLR